MISIEQFKMGKETYKNAKEYVNQKEITNELKNEIKYVLEKYRFYFTIIQEQEVLDLIDICVLENNSKPLQKELHSIGGPRYKKSDYSDGDREFADDDDEFIRD